MSRFIQYLKNTFLRIKATNWPALAGQKSRDPIFWVRFSAYAIPLAFLLYVLYLNFLPFGYNKTFIIDVGTKGDTKVGEFYLEPSRDLSDATTSPDGTAYRTLNGSAFAIFKPEAVLKNATITISVAGDKGISIIPPVLNFDPNTIKWDYSWDFTKEIPPDLTGNAFMFDGEATFNGRDTRLELPDSAGKFEDGPFTLYTEWKPTDDQNNAQQIVGHYNWELWQNKDSVEFRAGRMNDADGQAYSLKYPVTSEFFNTRHSAVAIYNPANNGYIDLFVDGTFAGRTYLGADKIWGDYGDQNLSFGWTPHNYSKSPYFSGIIYRANISLKNTSPAQPETSFEVTNNSPLNISIISTATSTLKQIKLHVAQR